MKRKFIILSGVMGMGILFLTSCGRDAAGKQGETGAVSGTDEEEDSVEGAQTDSAVLSRESREQAESDAGQTEPGNREDTEQEEKTEQSESETETEKAPQLPETGSRLTDFVPDGWELWDSVEMDFNEDGTPDYVGVLQAVVTDEEGDQTFRLEYPRILFAAASDKTAGYCLDFQDVNVIRTRDEGGRLRRSLSAADCGGYVFYHTRLRGQCVEMVGTLYIHIPGGGMVACVIREHLRILRLYHGL